MKQFMESFANFIVFGVFGWWPAMRDQIGEQRHLAEQGEISLRVYARRAQEIATNQALYSEMNSYCRIQAAVWGITIGAAAVQVYGIQWEDAVGLLYRVRMVFETLVSA